MAQRALIIGLGSTGYDACKHLVERVQWESGGLERAPWFEILCLETEPLSGDGPLEQNGIHIKIEPNDYANLLNNASSAQKIGLEQWWHPDSLLPLGANGVLKGAGNIRMIGRVAFLFPDNIDAIYAAIKTRLERLSPSNLTPERARAARGPLPDGSNPEVKLSDDIAVYVVGTLCGGTCSGSFIDLGYLLNYEFKQNKYPIRRVGIFALPHLSYTPKDWERRRANAWAALTELNHFMAEQNYSVQYPFYPDKRIDMPSIAPYDTTYLVQPRSGDLNAFETLKLTVSQFLHTDIFNPGASQMGARLIDSAADVTDGDANGSPQTYYSFGLSAIEIPGYLIAQGCCYKLGLEALDDYLGPRPNAPAEADAFRVNVLGISAEKVGERLLRDPETDSGAPQSKALRERIKTEVTSAASNARNAGGSAANELSKVEEKIEAAFATPQNEGGQESDALLTSQLPPHFVPRRVHANAAHLVSDYEATLSREMQLALLDPSRGPEWCRVILDGLEMWLVGRLSDLGSGKASEDLEKAQRSTKNELNDIRSRIDACANDFILWMFGGRKTAIDRHLQEYEEAANRAFQRRLESSLAGSERDLWSKVLPLVQSIKIKIVGTGSEDGSLLHKSQLLRDIFATRLASLDSTMPAINGKPIFVPKKTIEDVYGRTWNSRGVEEKTKAKRALLLEWSDLPSLDNRTGQLRANITFFASTGDPVTGDRLKLHLREIAEDLAQIVRRANYFATATQDSVLNHLTPPDTVELRETYEKASVMLSINWNSVSKNIGGKHANIAFFPGGSAVTTKPNTPEVSLWNAIQRVQTGGEILQSEDNANQQSLLFLRAAGGFSLATIEGFQDETFEQTNFRYSFAEASRGNTTLWSRHDIRDWHPFYGDKDAQSDWRKGLFLSALALSKSGVPEETIVRREGANYFYKPAQRLSPTKDRILLPSDLRGVAQILRSETEAQKRLVSDLNEARHNRPLDELAASLELLYNNVEQLGLTNSSSAFAKKAVDEQAQNSNSSHQNGYGLSSSTQAVAAPSNNVGQLNGDEALRLILEFWKVSDLEMVNKLNTEFKKDDLAFHVKWHEKDALHILAGYFCDHPSCSRHPYLGDQKAMVPETCPACGQQCR